MGAGCGEGMGGCLRCALVRVIGRSWAQGLVIGWPFGTVMLVIHCGSVIVIVNFVLGTGTPAIIACTQAAGQGGTS